MNDFNRMLKEYVIPFIILTVLLGCFWLFVGSSLGDALDKEASFNDEIKKAYLGNN
jgi:hypothetical protein